MLFGRALEGRFLFRGGGGGGGFRGGEFLAEGEEGGFVRGEAQAVGACVAGFGEFVQGEEGEGGAVEGFKVGGVEVEGGGAVVDCGAVVFWRVGVVRRIVSNLVEKMKTYGARGCRGRG